jgi:hypothetical protein
MATKSIKRAEEKKGPLETHEYRQMARVAVPNFLSVALPA